MNTGFTKFPISYLRNYRPFCNDLEEFNMIEVTRPCNHNLQSYNPIPLQYKMAAPKKEFPCEPRIVNTMATPKSFHQCSPRLVEKEETDSDAKKKISFGDTLDMIFDPKLDKDKWNIRFDGDFVKGQLVLKSFGVVVSKQEYRGNLKAPVKFCGSFAFSNPFGEECSADLLLRCKSTLNPGQLQRKNTTVGRGMSISQPSSAWTEGSIRGLRLRIFPQTVPSQDKAETTVSTSYTSRLGAPDDGKLTNKISTVECTEADIRNDIIFPEMVYKFRFVVVDYGEKYPMFTNVIGIKEESCEGKVVQKPLEKMDSDKGDEKTVPSHKKSVKGEFRYYSSIQEIPPFQYDLDEISSDHYVSLINTGKADIVIDYIDARIC